MHSASLIKSLYSGHPLLSWSRVGAILQCCSLSLLVFCLSQGLAKFFLNLGTHFYSYQFIFMPFPLTVLCVSLLTGMA